MFKRQWCVFVLVILASYLYAKEPNFGTYQGSAVIEDLNTSTQKVFGTFASEELPPCSTFKILNSLIALHTKVLKDENETIPWDGQIRTYDVWNKDQSMRSAIAVSAVWFYQEVARRVGVKTMQEMVFQSGYGNRDTLHTLTDFWLSKGSLKISAIQQVDFLAKLMRNQLPPFSKKEMATVRDIMTLEKEPNYTLLGKTGSCGGVGWFVGSVQTLQNTNVFAFVIKGENTSGAEAKRIAREYLLP